MYDVNQILYLLLNKKKKIVPVRIVEQIVRKTADGEKVSYVIQLPNSDNSKVLLSKIDCDIFTCKKTLRQSMISNATEAIDGLILNSLELCKRAFGESQNQQIADIDNIVINGDAISPLDNLELIKINESEDIVMVDLGNGIKGKIDATSIGNIV